VTFNGRNVILAEINKIPRAHHKKFNEDRRILLAVKCRPMILVSKNIHACSLRFGRHRQIGHEDNIFLIFPAYDVTQSVAPACTAGWRLETASHSLRLRAGPA